MNFLFNLYRALAHSIQYEVEQEWLPVKDAVGFDFTANTGSSNQQSTSSTAFQRQGSTNTGQTYQLPSWLSMLVQQAPEQTQMPGVTQSADWSFITNLLGQDPNAFYGTSPLSGILGLDPGSYDGKPSLDNIMARNPYSTDYENATSDLYDRQFNIARSAAQSGPANVRGGQARTGFALADTGTQEALNRFREVRGMADREAGIVEQAVHMGNTIEQMRRSSVLGAQQAGQGSTHTRVQEGVAGSDLAARSRAQNSANLQLAAELLGVKEQQVNENLKGQGQQIQSSSGGMSSSGWGVGGSPCCFIFLQALNGVLPWYVRVARDRFQTPSRRRGYVWMAKWLVPLMKKSSRWTWLVNFIMIKPFLRYGEALYLPVRPASLALRVWCWSWFWLWSFLGVIHNDTRL